MEERLKKVTMDFVAKKDIGNLETFDKWFDLKATEIMLRNPIYGNHFAINHAIMIPYEVYEMYMEDKDKGEITVTLKF